MTRNQFEQVRFLIGTVFTCLALLFHSHLPAQALTSLETFAAQYDRDRSASVAAAASESGSELTALDPKLESTLAEAIFTEEIRVCASPAAYDVPELDESVMLLASLAANP